MAQSITGPSQSSLREIYLLLAKGFEERRLVYRNGRHIGGVLQMLQKAESRFRKWSNMAFCASAIQIPGRLVGNSKMPTHEIDVIP